MKTLPILLILILCGCVTPREHGPSPEAASLKLYRAGVLEGDSLATRELVWADFLMQVMLEGKSASVILIEPSESEPANLLAIGTVIPGRPRIEVGIGGFDKEKIPWRDKKTGGEVVIVHMDMKNISAKTAHFFVSFEGVGKSFEKEYFIEKDGTGEWYIRTARIRSVS